MCSKKKSIQKLLESWTDLGMLREKNSAFLLHSHLMRVHASLVGKRTLGCAKGALRLLSHPVHVHHLDLLSGLRTARVHVKQSISLLCRAISFW